MSVTKIHVNPEEDLVEEKVYEFKTINGQETLLFQGLFQGYLGEGEERCANFIVKHRTGTKAKCFPLSGFNNTIIPETVKLILGPNLPPPPSYNDRNIPKLQTLVRRQLSTKEIHDLNTSYVMPPNPGKLYARGLKSKRRRNKKITTKTRKSNKTKRRHNKK